MSEIGGETHKKDPSKKRDHMTLSHLLLVYLFYKKDGAIQQNILSALTTSKKVFADLIKELRKANFVEEKTKPMRHFKIKKDGITYTEKFIDDVYKKDYRITLSKITVEEIEKLRTLK